MLGITPADAPMLLLGLVFGATLLCAGVVGGVLLARRERKPPPALEPQQVVEFLRGLVEWTSGMANEVAEYQEIVRGVAQKIDDSRQEPEVDGQEEVEPKRWLRSLVSANQRLKSRLEEAEETLQRQSSEMANIVMAASTDPLTGLPNRRVYDEELKRRFAEWRRHGTPFSVMLVDVDHFKTVNDNYGHIVGDQVLKEVAASLRATMRESDLVSRFGGEEFATVLPASGPEDASRAAERARLAIERVLCEHDGGQLQVTVSCGVAHATTEDTPERMLDRADKALYAAKNAGRNAAFWHDGQICQAVTCSSSVRRPASPAGLASRPPEELQLLCEALRRRYREVVGANTVTSGINEACVDA